MPHNITPFARSLAVILGLVIVAGCNKSCTGSVSTSSDWTVNGRRTISRTHDGVARKLETTSDVVLQDGRISVFPKGALVKLKETAGHEQRLAELRENGGNLELWINKNGTFRKGSPDDKAWLERFLNDVTSK